MPDGPIRRSQLISPFGVGALTVNEKGLSILTCGLDHWFKKGDGSGDSRDIEPSEFRVQEWRLERRLGVNYFMLPPDFRTKKNVFQSDNSKNLYLTVPFHRFPRWHVCQRIDCRRLYRLPLATRGRKICKEIGGGECRGKLVQVPIVAICDKGHLDDFPWREWAHKTVTPPDCGGFLRLNQTARPGLAGLEVECTCGKAKRNLGSITQVANDGETTLSSSLDSDKKRFSCCGSKPWLGGDEADDCSQPIRGALRSSNSLYMADVRSSIFIPQEEEGASSEIYDLLNDPPFSSYLSIAKAAEIKPSVAEVRTIGITILEGFDDQTIQTAVDNILEGSTITPSEDELVEDDDEETAFRRIEYKVLGSEQSKSQLRVQPISLNSYEDWISTYFNKIHLVHQLKETRAFVGFSRVNDNDGRSTTDRMKMLRADDPPKNRAWLPAYVVHGEGIFLQLKEEALSNWETTSKIAKPRATKLEIAYDAAMTRRGGAGHPISPRFVLIHTLAHLLINQLTFECGYSTAALRERLFVSDSSTSPMSGLLIYTASGDAEGTLGGLVRMGRPGYLEPIVKNAIRESRWCSADPICMEIGTDVGQGPDSCNLAACHNCGLLPETACEHMNRFLDRGVIIGDAENPSGGFFSDLS